MHVVVRDGQRQLEFDGELLAMSTSKSIGRTRWVEFELYRTVGGQYVLSRVGRSVYYHDPSCPVVKRNRIPAVFFDEIDHEDMLPCESCMPHPSSEDAQVCPEQPRYWAQVSSEAEGIVESLQKFDDNGTRYLTNVARRLLTEASARDDAIRDEFYHERIA